MHCSTVFRAAEKLLGKRKAEGIKKLIFFAISSWAATKPEFTLSTH